MLPLGLESGHFNLFQCPYIRQQGLIIGRIQIKGRNIIRVKIIFSIQIALFLTALLISGICDSDTVAIVFAGMMLALNVASWFLTRSK